MTRLSRSSLMKASAMGCLLLSGQVIASPSLTIYNGNFAVVRDQISLDLKKGHNQVRYQDITHQVEADSVVLRAKTKGQSIQIQEQNYLSKPINQQLLLEHYEGQTIDFEITRNQKTEILPGKIIRSGGGSAYNNTPIIELEGKTRFGLPGTPLFPPLKNEALLKPTLDWSLSATQSTKTNLELAYLTGGLSWKADYNLVAQKEGNKLDLNGWVTFNNFSGKNFAKAKIKLMAGDINKIQPSRRPEMMMKAASMDESRQRTVTEKDFDEYHLYSIQQSLNLDDGESKQIGFIEAQGVKSRTLFVYDGAQINRHYRTNPEHIRTDPNYGTQSNRDVHILREFNNTKDNGLGIPLPEGRVRFYQQDDDGQLEFLGENTVDHSPKNATISIYTGNAFDIKGDRKRINFQTNNRENWVKESFEITLENQKKTSATVKVVEHLYRWANWDIEKSSQKHTKTDSQTIEFEVNLKPEEVKNLTYTVHYSW